MRLKPPGPHDWLFGMSFSRRLQRTPLEFLSELGQTYGDLAYVRMGPIRFYLVNHPDLIRDALVTKAKCFRKLPRLMDVLRQIEGNGIVVTEGDFWLRQRRLVQPAFAAKRLSGYAQVMLACTVRAIEKWRAGQVLHIDEEMRQVTLAIIAKTLFDVELTDQVASLGAAGQVLAHVLVREMTGAFRLPDWLPLPGKRRKRWAIRVFDELIQDIIRQRRASKPDKGDLLSMLLSAVDVEGDGKGLADCQVRDEAMTLFHAGHETTAVALTWVWYLLARHREVATAIEAEVKEVLGRNPVTFADLPRLQVTERAIKEALRLYPPTWVMFLRETLTEVELGDYRIPPGAWLCFSPYVTHHDGRFFPDPERFDTGRFAPPRAAEVPAYGYFPFGVGPHVCIGNTFAMIEMILIVATVLQRCRLSLAPGRPEAKPSGTLTLRPKGGVWLEVDYVPEAGVLRS